jgi:cytochrome b involved in lipid metabolism
MDFFTMKDVEKNNGENNTIWIVIKNNVYNVSSYMKRDLHPGGNEVLQKYAGKDATESFSVLHSDDAWSELEQIL